MTDADKFQSAPWPVLTGDYDTAMAEAKAGRVIIAGGRDFASLPFVEFAVRASGLTIREVVSGACGVSSSKPNLAARGADGLGEAWAKRNGIPVKRFIADQYGKWPSCGPRRNGAMAEYGGALIALPGGRGTDNMVEQALRRGLIVHDFRGGK